MTIAYPKQGLLFILVGPTGAGKNTIMNAVLKRMDDLAQLPTATSRAIRPTEKEGREHHFVTEAEFRDMIDNHELLEWQEVHGRLYGVPRGTVERLIANKLDRIADIDVLGALDVKALYPDNVVIIFVQPGADDDVEATVRERLIKRGESEAEIENRLQRVRMEMSYAPLCDYLVVNEDIEQAVNTVEGIVLAERSRRRLANLRVRHNLPRHRLIHSTITLAIFEGKILCKDGKLPQVRLIEGEIPQEAATRAVTDVLKLHPHGNITPIYTSLTQKPHYEDMIYWFQFTTAPTQDLPENWSWQDVDSIELPEAVRNQIPSTSY